MDGVEYQTEEMRWQAVVGRDPAADGRFYYAVRTTGIYCRPTCPSRRPKRANVAFFETATAAEQAGYRPCQRCRPAQLTTEQRVVAQVEQILQRAEEAPSLAELGQAVGLSPFHLQRLFKRATGLSPRAYASLARAERLKTELKRGAKVTDALYQAGYGSSRALYDQAKQRLGMTPGAYQKGGAGEQIHYACAETFVGSMLLAATARGVCALRFGEASELVAELHREFPRATIREDVARLKPYIQMVQAHLTGAALDLPLDLKGTAFQERVWAALRSIPRGEVRSYKQVAELIGEPKSTRAVARACATNPVALAVPCHRVVRANGDLSGYRWGLRRKEALLRAEQRSTAGQAEGD